MHLPLKDSVIEKCVLKCEKTKEQMPTATKQPLPQSDDCVMLLTVRPLSRLYPRLL